MHKLGSAKTMRVVSTTVRNSTKDSVLVAFCNSRLALTNAVNEGGLTKAGAGEESNFPACLHGLFFSFTKFFVDISLNLRKRKDDSKFETSFPFVL